MSGRLLNGWGTMDWHFVNLVIPILLPLAMMGIVSNFPMEQERRKNAHWFAAIKDGQMAWVGLGICVNSLYEIRHPSQAVNANFVTIMFWALIITLVMLTTIAAMSPVFPNSSKQPFQWSRDSLRNYVVMLTSVCITVLAAFISGTVHILTQR